MAKALPQRKYQAAKPRHCANALSRLIAAARQRSRRDDRSIHLQQVKIKLSGKC
jgi:hypothetical protein